MSSVQEAKFPPHVLIFPVPSQGHLNCMLNLAHLLCLSKIAVTFIVSDFIHRRLLKNTAVHSTFAQYPTFRFQPISDGLPDDHPRAGERFLDMFSSIKDIMVPLFKDFFASAANQRPITCMIGDGSLYFVADFAEEHDLPLIYFRTASVSYFWSLFRLGELIEAREIPFTGDSMDELVKSVPGTESFLRRRDLPSFCRVEDSDDPLLQDLKASTKQIVRAQAAIFNTFEDLDGSLVSEVQKEVPIRIFTIGPLHSLLKSRRRENSVATTSSLSGSSLWAEDWSCLDWLNQQPPKSVIYVSFGSITMVTREQLLEFWHGLVNSSQRFLWVVRPDSVTGKDGESEIPAELAKGTKERGYLVEWAPQEEVLNHPSVGGFLTHSGWNSTLESIGAGVPMICWPYFGDQTINSRFVSEVWKIGLDIKDTCDRLLIESAIREVMEVRKDEFLERVDHMAKLLGKAVSKGGSSSCNLDGLIEYIKSLVI